jgi:hypothetical protein
VNWLTAVNAEVAGESKIDGLLLGRIALPPRVALSVDVSVAERVGSVG